MSYVIAGYVVALSALAMYAVSLVLRRRRLERAVSNAESSPLEADPPVPGRGGEPPR